MSEPGAEWKMPKPFHGEIVRWFPHGDVQNPPEAAIVLVASDWSVDLCLFKSTGPRPVSGCRHVGDPRNKPDDIRALGGWDFIPKENVASLSRLYETLKENQAQTAKEIAELRKLFTELKKVK